jgi:hypothetical protein
MNFRTLPVPRTVAALSDDRHCRSEWRSAKGRVEQVSGEQLNWRRRNGRKMLAPSTLNVLPKFEFAAILMYFVDVAKHLSP